MTDASPAAARANGVFGRRLLRGLPAGVYAAAIFYGGVINIGPLPAPGFVPTDKFLHFAIFGGFEILVELALSELPETKRRVLAILSAVLVGLLLEFVQATLPNRSAEALDVLADSLGALAAAGCLLLLGRLRAFAGSAR